MALLTTEIVKVMRKKLPPDKIPEKRLKKATNLTHSWGKRLMLIKLLKEKKIHTQFAHMQVDLERDPQSPEIQARIEECKVDLKALDVEKHKWIQETI